jgi:CRP-like cAMP-binding protein
MSDKKNLKLSNHLLDFRKHMDRLVVFSDDEWAVLCSHLYLKKLNKKQHFAIDGEICDDLGFIISGSLRFYYVKDGEEITGYYSPNNRFISSYKSFIRRKASTLAIQAVEESLLINLNYKSLQQLLENPVTGHKMERFCRLIAEELIDCYEDRMQAFITLSPQERYTDLLSDKPCILKEMPQHYLANYLGITATSLSRIRKRIFLPGK